MSESFGRVFGGMAALAVIWIIVYWWWEPRGGAITFDPGTHAPSAALGGEAAPTAPDRPAAGFDPAPMEGEIPAAPTGPASRPEPAPLIPPRFREYTVKGGDTLARIAERELGSRGYVEAIIRSNPLTSPENLTRAGRTIRLPIDPGNIRGAPNPEAAAPPAPKPEPGASEPPPAAGAGFAEYTVKEGDTLSGISKDHYGTIRYADLIAQANGIDADHLKIGQKLRLPPKPR